jgi:hypothetical protein
MNINLTDTANSITLYYDLLNSFNFIQYINCPTRPLTNSCIDQYIYMYIFIRDNHKHYNIHSAVIDSLITDNYPLFLQLNHTVPQQTKNSNNNSYKFVNFRELKKAINNDDYKLIHIS